MTAPSVKIRAIRHAGSNWVPVNVANQLQQIRIAVNKSGFEPTPEKLPVTFVNSVEALRVHSIDVAYTAGQIS